MKHLTYVFLVGIMLLLVGCASETQPFPDINVAVEEKITEEIAKAVDTATPLPTATAELTATATLTPLPTDTPTSYPSSTPPAATPSPTPPTVPTVQPFVEWSDWETGEWAPSSTPPECGPLEEMFDVFPIEPSLLSSIGLPGQPGGNGSYYLTHGFLRADDTPHDQIEVKFPAEGFSLHAVSRRLEDYYLSEVYGQVDRSQVPIEERETDTIKHIVGDEEQVRLEFRHPCGISIRFSHLAQVTDRWAEIIKDVPVLTNDSRVTDISSGQYFVESGEVLAHAIGHATNTYLSFAVHDLRSKNDSAEMLARDWPEYASAASYGICWTGLFGPEVQKLLEGMTAGFVGTSDFCD